jgi:hypothetical protein
MDLNKFFSENPLEIWKSILGEKMHYHYMSVDNSEHDPFDYAIMQLFDFIKPNSKILDCGCGWGGPARLLKQHLNCNITGVTISEQQYKYITDFKVIYKDLHDFIPNEQYDTAFFIESYVHFNDSKKIINNIKNNVNELVIKDFVNISSDEIIDVPRWGGFIRSYKVFKDDLESNGFNIMYYKEISHWRKASMNYWLNNIEKLPPEEIYGQIELLYELCLNNKKSIEFDPNEEQYPIRQCIIHAVKK